MVPRKDTENTIDGAYEKRGSFCENWSKKDALYLVIEFLRPLISKGDLENLVIVGRGSRKRRVNYLSSKEENVA